MGRWQEEREVWDHGRCGEGRGGKGWNEDCGAGGRGEEGDGVCLMGSGLGGWGGMV